MIKITKVLLTVRLNSNLSIDYISKLHKVKEYQGKLITKMNYTQSYC